MAKTYALVLRRAGLYELQREGERIGRVIRCEDGWSIQLDADMPRRSDPWRTLDDVRNFLATQ